MRKRSPERRKANKVLARIHERIRNRRHDFVHQTARRLVNRFGVIAVEKLNVNPAYTSQDCSVCTASLDRDTNAAVNILNFAINNNRSGITACQGKSVEAPTSMSGK